MQCTSCGADVPGGAQFCPQCGTRIGGADDQFDPAAQLHPGPRIGGPDVPEDELWTGTYSPKAMFGMAAAAIVVTVLGLIGVVVFWNTGAGWATLAITLLVIWAGLALVLAYRRLTVRYRLTTYRFFHERGLLSRATDRIEVIDIDDVTVHQGLVERMVGVGTIVIQSSDRTDPELALSGIEDVKRVADLVDDTRRAERHRRGLHIESI